MDVVNLATDVGVPITNSISTWFPAFCGVVDVQLVPIYSTNNLGAAITLDAGAKRFTVNPTIPENKIYEYKLVIKDSHVSQTYENSFIITITCRITNYSLQSITP